VGLILNARLSRGSDISDPADAKDFDLTDTPLPGQAAALSALASIEADRKYGEHLFSQAAGTRKDQTAKLAIARARTESSKAA
jgi:hypothetical protein